MCKGDDVHEVAIPSIQTPPQRKSLVKNGINRGMPKPRRHYLWIHGNGIFALHEGLIFRVNVGK